MSERNNNIDFSRTSIKRYAEEHNISDEQAAE